MLQGIDGGIAESEVGLDDGAAEREAGEDVGLDLGKDGDDEDAAGNGNEKEAGFMKDDSDCVAVE